MTYREKAKELREAAVKLFEEFLRIERTASEEAFVMANDNWQIANDNWQNFVRMLVLERHNWDDEYIAENKP